MIYWRVTQVNYEEEYKLILSFYDGSKKRIDLKAYLEGEIFEPLKNIEYFKKVYLEGSSVAWDNGADFAPEFLYENGVDIETEKQQKFS
jgi:Protein of unknown function (DUF2442)